MGLSSGLVDKLSNNSAVAVSLASNGRNGSGASLSMLVEVSDSGENRGAVLQEELDEWSLLVWGAEGGSAMCWEGAAMDGGRPCS